MEEMPEGLLLELARDARARQRFSALSRQERDRVVTRARAARTRADMRLIVMSLDDRDEVREYY